MSILRWITCSLLLITTAVTPSLASKGGDAQKHNEVVRYSDFGAVGDGQTDDLDAIIAAHKYANKHGLPVGADDDAKHYIGKGGRTAIIETDTDFGSAEFLIDDKVVPVEKRHDPIFSVRSKMKFFPVEGIGTLKIGQKNIGRKLSQPCLLLIKNDRVRRFIRHGSNRNSGAPQTDIILVDENGNVDKSTPIAWNFDHISECTAYPIDQTALNISGGRFTTIANNAEVASYTSYGRNIHIRRSNVVVDGLQHFLTGEGEHGAPYGGFIRISKCANVTVKNGRLAGHKTYYANDGVPMGSYDININSSANISFIGVTQSNDIEDRSRWGIMGSNYCKNLLYKDCRLSRFDAHQGVVNATILDSTLRVITVTGKGLLRIEDSEVRGRSFVSLRSDYGSTWQGVFLIKDCVWVPASPTSSLINGRNLGKHDFGYTCYMPKKIFIDNLYIDDSALNKERLKLKLFANFNPALKDDTYKQEYPYITTEQVVLKNARTASGKPLELSDNEFMFKDVEVIRSDP